MTITEVRMPCPDCHDPAKAKRVILESAETTLPGHIPPESVACSNPDCARWNEDAWSPSG